MTNYLLCVYFTIHDAKTHSVHSDTHSGKRWYFVKLDLNSVYRHYLKNKVMLDNSVKQKAQLNISQENDSVTEIVS